MILIGIDYSDLRQKGNEKDDGAFLTIRRMKNVVSIIDCDKLANLSKDKTLMYDL